MNVSKKGVLNVRLFWLNAAKQPNGCWLWRGAPNGPEGYGRVRVAGRIQYVHRVAWSMARGPIPPDLCVCHRCDTPLCVNPAHLFLGTVRDNNLDRIAKGRRGVGSFVEIAA